MYIATMYIWAYPPLTFMKYEHESPKLNVVCAIAWHCIIGPFSFTERIVSGIAYFVMLELL